MNGRRLDAESRCANNPCNKIYCAPSDQIDRDRRDFIYQTNSSTLSLGSRVLIFPRTKQAVMTHVVLLSTCKNEAEARKIARNLLESKLIACANIAPISSIYLWKGKLEEAKEQLLIMKTLSEKVSAIKETIRSLHSYEIPELLSLEIREGMESYLGWIRSELVA